MVVTRARAPVAPQAVEAVNAAVDRLRVFNRRTLDFLTARIYSYFCLAYEACGRLKEIRTYVLWAARVRTNVAD